MKISYTYLSISDTEVTEQWGIGNDYEMTPEQLIQRIRDQGITATPMISFTIHEYSLEVERFLKMLVVLTKGGK